MIVGKAAMISWRPMHRKVTPLTLTAALLVLGCKSLNVPPPNEQSVCLNDAVAARASTLYASLQSKAGPESGFVGNAQAYGATRADVAALGGRVAAEDAPMRRATTSLAGAVAAAERSRQLASRTADDRHGLCLSPGAITLNADAIARATAAINQCQQARSRLMLFDVALVARGMADAFLRSLKADGTKIKALAADKAQKLALSLATLGELLRAGEIDREEAEALIDVQRAATEKVFAALEDIGSAAARRATRAGLSSAAGAVDKAIGIPFVATLTEGAST